MLDSNRGPLLSDTLHPNMRSGSVLIRSVTYSRSLPFLDYLCLENLGKRVGVVEICASHSIGKGMQILLQFVFSGGLFTNL